LFGRFAPSRFKKSFTVFLQPYPAHRESALSWFHFENSFPEVFAVIFK
jgi:hypothetical protein